MASGLGEPLYTERSKLVSNRFGIAKVKVVMKLDKKFPSAVRVCDKLGNTVTVLVEYSHTPHKCQGCNEFGHLPLCCPKLIVPTTTTTSSLPPEVARSIVPSSGGVLVNEAANPPITRSSPVALLDTVPIGQISRATSLPSFPLSDQDSSSSSWTYVARRSKPNLAVQSSSISSHKVTSLTSSKFIDEEDIIIEAQRVLWGHLKSTTPAINTHKSAKSLKKARKKLRQRVFQESQSGTEVTPIVSTSISLHRDDMELGVFRFNRRILSLKLNCF